MRWLVVMLALVSMQCAEAVSLEDSVPQIVSTIPQDDTNDVALDTVVSVTLSVPLDPDSVVDDSLVLELDSERVDGEATLDAARTTLTFTADKPFALLGSYTATLSNVRGVDGVPFVAPQSWQFTMRDGVWSAQRIERNDGGSASKLQVAIDPTGNAVATWIHLDTLTNESSVWVNRFTDSIARWEGEEEIDTDVQSSGIGPQVAIDAQGNAIVVWERSGVEGDSVWADRFTASSNAWDGPTRIGLYSSGGADMPALTMDPAGNGICVWARQDGGGSEVWTNRFSSSNGEWGEESSIDNLAFGRVSGLRIVSDDQGDAHATWRRQDGSLDNIATNRFTASGMSWGTVERIDISGGDKSPPEVAVNPQGDAVTVWSEFSGSSIDLWSSRALGNGAWGTPERVYIANNDIENHPIATNAQGDAVLVWIQTRSSGFDVWSGRFTESGGWLEAAIFQSNPSVRSTNVGGPDVVMDALGNAIAVWAEPNVADTANVISTSRFNASVGSWSAAESIETNGDGGAAFPHIVVGEHGEAVVVWQQFEGSDTDIWAATFR